MGFRAFNSGVSGLQSHNTWLDVIGNNVANSNTTAFKGARVAFADQLSQSIGAGSPNQIGSLLGGTNPLQIGLGSRLTAIQTLFAQGPLIQSTSNLDVALEGKGFLLVDQGGKTYLSRSGNLLFDGQGYLVDSQGGLVQGYTASSTFTTRVLNSFSGVPGQSLLVNDATMVLRTDNPEERTAIRIQSTMTIPPRATTQITFQGNLDAFIQVNQEGGIADLAPGGQPVLPIAVNMMLFPPEIAVDPTRIVREDLPGGGFTFRQVSNMSDQIQYPILNGGIDMAWVRIFDGNYAWQQEPRVPPAAEVETTVYDSHGNPRELTIQFYQVNDLGAMNVNPYPGPSQALYAWYAFDTTGGQEPDTPNLVGGTGIMEGEMTAVPDQFWYDRGRTTPGPSGMGDLYIGDFLWFNTDGSLATPGGCGGPVPTPPGVPNYMAVPRIYLPVTNDFNPPRSPYPTLGSEIMAIDLDFGTYGLLGKGRRDGITCDAAGSYETKDGVLQYVPNNSVVVRSQDGYPQGQLMELSWDTSGILQGKFSNNRTIDLAQLALVDVQNPGGLAKVGNNYYEISANSGDMRVGLPGQDGLATIRGFALEGSNVDIAEQLTNLVVAQRGLEANARLISDQDSVDNTLTNLGR